MSTTEIMPDVEVPGVAPVPYPFGLFSIAPAGTPGDPHWQTGVWWRTAACNLVGVTHNPCTVDDEVPAKAPNVTCGIGQAAAFTVYAMSDQSIGGASLDEKFAQARDLLLAGEQFAVETVLWELLNLATVAPDATAATVSEAVAKTEQLISSAYGGTPVLHLSRYAATLAGAEGGVLRVEGSKLRSFLGSGVVAGAGYGTIADDVSVIGTGGLVVVRSEVFDLGKHFDRDTNTISAVVERTYAVGWDCTAVRVEVAP